MERTKYIICLISIICLNITASHSQTDYRKSIYNAYIQGNMPDWQSTMREMEKQSLSPDNQLELLSYYYGYIGYLIGNSKSKSANEYIKKGEKLIDELLKNNPDNATAIAYKGSFISFKIALNKLKAVTLGTQSMKYINKAYTIDSKNVQALADKANMLYYAPGMFGGNKAEAIVYYKKAISQLETNNDTTNNWFYLNLLTLLAQRYEEMGKKADALSIYQKILQKESNYEWVRDELYPELMESK